MSEHNPVLSPKHYAGDGTIECKHAMASMIQGWEENGNVDYATAYWLTCAFKYLWRAPIKNGLEDINKAMECLCNAQESWLRNIPTNVNREILATSRGVRENFLWNPHVSGEINEDELRKAKDSAELNALKAFERDIVLANAKEVINEEELLKAKKVWEDTTREEYEDYCERAGYDAEKYAEARKALF